MEGGPFRIRRSLRDPRESYAPPRDRVNREPAPSGGRRFLRFLVSAEQQAGRGHALGEHATGGKIEARERRDAPDDGTPLG